MIGNGSLNTITEIWITDIQFEEGNIATDWTPAPEDVDADIEAAQDMAVKANAAAQNAQAAADAAAYRLSLWAQDGVISPTEKQGIIDEIARIDADKNLITNGYTLYGLGTPTAYNTAYTNYRAQLVTLSATSPETITIPSSFATNQTAYYTQRTAALYAIDNATKTQLEEVKKEIAGLDYIKEALVGGRTEQSGGLMLTSLIQLGVWSNDVLTVYSGINGLYNTQGAKGIAAWYGGDMLDGEVNGWSDRYAQSLFRFDGSGYLAGGSITWDEHGNGSLGRDRNGNPVISWNANGVSLSSAIKLGTGDETLTTVLNVILQFNSMFELDTTSVFGKTVIRAKYDGFYSDGFIAAGGVNPYTSDGGASYLRSLKDVDINLPLAGQILVYNGSKWANQALAVGGTTALSALTDVSLTDIAAGQILQYNGKTWVNTTINTNSGETLTFLEMGDGNVVTNVIKSGQIVTVTKGITALTSHQSIYAATFSAGAFSAKTYTPNMAAETINIPTHTSHLTNDSGFITSSALAWGNITNKPNRAGSETDGGAANISKLLRYTDGHSRQERIQSANIDTSDGAMRYYVTSTTITDGSASEGHLLHLSWDDINHYNAQLLIPHTDAYGIKYRYQRGVETYNNWINVLDELNYASFLDERYVNKSVLTDYATQSWVSSQGYLKTLALGGLSNVVLSSPTSGQVLQYNGTNWVNATVSTGGTASSIAWGNVTSKPTTIAGYGITDAKISGGTITIGSNSITPITSHQSLSGYLTTSAASSTYLAKSGGTINGYLYVQVIGIKGPTANSDGYISSDAASNMYFNVGGKTPLVLTTTTIFHGSTITSGTLDFGRSDRRWKTVYCVSVDNGSDERLKNITGNINIPVEFIAFAPAVAFTWKYNGENGYGTIAQYWKSIAQGIVKEDDRGYLSMDYSTLSMVSVISVARKVVDHERRIAELERENCELRKEVESLKAA